MPVGEALAFGDGNYFTSEEAGMREIAHCAFVLVAGGLGERLGYGGIKVELPAETTTGVSFLELYAQSILAFQEKFGGGRRKIPLAIMVRRTM